MNFRINTLSSYDMIFSPWRSLSAIKSPAVKCKLPTTNYLSPWKVHLYHKIDMSTLVKSQEQVICVHKLLLLFCLSTQSYSLAALIAAVACMHVSSCMQSNHLVCMRSLHCALSADLVALQKAKSTVWLIMHVVQNIDHFLENVSHTTSSVAI